VAKLRKHHHPGPGDGQRVELTGLGAVPAEGADIRVNPGHRDAHGRALADLRLQEEVAVGGLHVAIDILGIRQRQHKVGGHRGLSGTALAAGDCDGQG